MKPPPRSPKPNGAAERAPRTHAEKFHEVRPFDAGTVDAFNREGRAWERHF